MELVAKSNTKSIAGGILDVNLGYIGSQRIEVSFVCFEKGVSKSIYIKGGNTTNLFSHLRFHHPKEFAIVQEPKTTGKTSRERSSASKQVTIADVSKYSRSSKRWQSVTSDNLLSKRYVANTHCGKGWLLMHDRST